MAIIILWGGGGKPRRSPRFTQSPPPPPGWKFERVTELPWPWWTEADGRAPGFTTKKGSTLAWWPG